MGFCVVCVVMFVCISCLKVDLLGEMENITVK